MKCRPDQMRADFHAIDGEEKLAAFIKKYENSDCSKSKPYLASAIMNQAEYAFWPNQKLAYFRKGKARLESFIRNNSTDLEGRYIRALVQSITPAFLNYRDNLKTDIRFIKENINQSDLPKSFQKVILDGIEKIEQ